jgi:hypothetical protein
MATLSLGAPWGAAQGSELWSTCRARLAKLSCCIWMLLPPLTGWGGAGSSGYRERRGTSFSATERTSLTVLRCCGAGREDGGASGAATACALTAGTSSGVPRNPIEPANDGIRGTGCSEPSLAFWCSPSRRLPRLAAAGTLAAALPEVEAWTPTLCCCILIVTPLAQAGKVTRCL